MAIYDARRPPGPPPEESELLPLKPNEQEVYARHLRNAYNREDALRRIRVCDEDVTVSEVKPNKAWMALARALLLHNVDPERFIHAAFLDSVATDATLAHGPFANNLTGDGLAKHLEKYRKYCVRADIQLEEEWRANATQFELAAADLRRKFPKRDIKRLWHFALTSERYKLSPLFKYCIAASEELVEVQAIEWGAAVLQLLTDPQGYLRVWKERIPKGLKAHVEYMLE